ncbi:ABC transporter permease [Candidatus Bipolaricaulota bacterium]|nr:ABC transporter permease [Candidatus Bipolaricaulota bacterium]
MFITVVVGVYIVIFVANMGGEVDQMRREQIRFEVTQQIYANPEYQDMEREKLENLIEDTIQRRYSLQGLDRPFIFRSFRYLRQAISLNLGRSEQVTSDSGSRQVRRVLVERLPPTLLLFATAQLLIFFTGIAVALYLAQRYGTILDRSVIALAPTSAAPGWFYALFLILIFAGWLDVMPWGGMVKAPPPDGNLAYALSLLRHLTLPAVAIFMGAIFRSIYGWRTYFLIHSKDEYVEMAEAKGLTPRAIQRRYILRPSLPYVVTTFLLIMITMWMGQVVLETVTNWPGVGSLFIQAINLNDTPIIVGVSVIYAYLLATTVFSLDFIYAIVDPRIRVGEGGRK